MVPPERAGDYTRTTPLWHRSMLHCAKHSEAPFDRRDRRLPRGGIA